MTLLYIPTDYQTRWNEKSLPTLSKNFEWEGRDDYITWVNDWKSLLISEINCVREAKSILKQKEVSPVSRAVAQRERARAAVRCANLYFLRTHAKLQAGRQTPTRDRQEHKAYIVTH